MLHDIVLSSQTLITCLLPRDCHHANFNGAVTEGSFAMQALNVFKALRVAAVVVAAAALLTASGLVGGGARIASVPVLALGIAAVVCCAAWQKLSGQVEKFYFTDYRHSET